MKVDFSRLDVRERPVLVLKNLDGTALQTLGYAFNVEIELSFNEVSTVTFSLPAQVNGSPTPHYDEVVGMRIVELVGVGQFYLLDPSEESDGTRKVKSCKAYSLEYEFAKKNIYLEEGTYNFYDGLNPDNKDTIIGRIREVMPDWNVSFDSAALGDLVGRYRTFDDINKKVYEFMKTDVQEKYGCIFDFDTMTRTIHVVSATAKNDNVKRVYLSEDNLIKSIKVDEDSDGIVTCLNVFGDEDVDIRSVNPTGENKIYNLDYFMTTDNFSQDLIDKWHAWEAAVDAQRSNYYNIQMQYNMLLLQILMAENGLSDTRKTLSSLQNQQASIIQGISTGLNTQGNLNTINGQISSAQTTAAGITSSIGSMKAQAAALLAQMQEINESLAMDAAGTMTTKSIASCPLATFSDGVEDTPVAELTVSFQPEQSYNGYSRPWAGGAGDNMLNPLVVADENKYVSASNGRPATPSASSGAVWRHTDFIPVVPGDVLYFGEINATAGAAGTAFYREADQTTFISGVGVTATQLGNANNVWTVPEGAAYMRHSFRVDAGYNTDWETSVYIVRNTATHQWSPYANICEITGHTGANIYVSPTTDAQDGTTYPISWQSSAGTVYGGTLDAATGTLTATYGVIANYNNDVLPGTWISDRDAYVAGTTPTIGAQVVYELGTPVIQQITATQIPVLHGTNNIWSDKGNVSVTYYASTSGYTYFTPSELAILRRYFIEDTIQDNSFVASSVSTYTDTSMNISLNNAMFTISNGALTHPSESVYRVKGGTASISTLNAAVTYANLEIGTNNTFTFAVSLGRGNVGDAAFGTGNLVLSGTYSSLTSSGGTLTLGITNGKMYFTQDANDYQRHQVEWELLQYGESVLREKASPTYHFSVECANFLNIDDFAAFKNQLEFGQKVYLNLNDTIYNPYVVTFHISYEDASSCSISFSDSYTSFDQSFSLAKLLEQSVSMGKSLSYKSGQYAAFVNSGASSQVKEFIESSLDIAKNAILSSDSQDITIDDTGIRLRRYKKDDFGNYVVDSTGAKTHEPEEIWMTDSSILFTDDNWATAKMAIGRIYRDTFTKYIKTSDSSQDQDKTYYVNEYGTVWDPDIHGAWSADLYEEDTSLAIQGVGEGGYGYGIVADYLIGKMIVGQNMIIECAGPDGNTMLFKVDGRGATINNGTFTVTNGNSKVVISPDGGIGVGTLFMSYDAQSGWNNAKFYVDTGGNAHFAGTLSGADGTFTGTLSGVDGTFSGSLSGATGTFSGTLQAASGTFNGIVRASDFQTLSGSSIIDPDTGQIIPQYESMMNSSGQFKSEFLEVTGVDADDVMDIVANGCEGIYVSYSYVGGELVTHYYLNASYLKSGTIDTMQINVGDSYGKLQEYTGSTTVEGSGYTTSGIQMYTSGGDVAASNFGAHMQYDTAQIWVASGVCSSSVPMTVVSDRRLKHDISYEIDSYEEFFRALSPVSYKYNNGSSNRKHIGFIAQDIEDALMEAGLTTSDFAGLTINDYGKDIDEEEYEGTGYYPHQYGLRYGEFIALNTHMIQKLYKRVEALEARLAARE